MVKGLRSVEGESGAMAYLASSIVWQMRRLQPPLNGGMFVSGYRFYGGTAPKFCMSHRG